MSDEITLSPQDGENVRKSVENLKRKYQKKVCKYCGEPIMFKEYEGRVVPHDLDEVPHWSTCPYSNFTQKKSALGILKKIAVHFASNDPECDFETLFNLTKREGKVFHAVLEKLLKTVDSPEESQVVSDELSFKPEPTDPVGDPDEERAPDEDLIKETSPEELVKSEE